MKPEITQFIIKTILIAIGSYFGWWSVKIDRNVEKMDKKITEVQAGIIGMPTGVKK